MKTKLRLSVIMLLFLAAMLFASAFVAAFTDLPVYDNPILVAVLALFTLLTAASCFSKRWFTLKRCSFIICHLAVVIFFIAAFVWYVWGVRGNMALYEGGNASRVIYEVKDGEIISSTDLPFTIGVTDFEIEYHPYEYTYSVVEGGGYKEKGTAKLTAEGFDCGKYGKVPASAVFDSEGNMQTQIQYDGMLLTWNGETPGVKQYHADIVYSDGGSDSITINYPATHQGWKIYLLSYSYQATEAGMNWIVTLQVKKDPASYFAIAGLVLCPIGTFLMCMRPRRANKKEEEVEAND